MSTTSPAIEMRNITKRFPGIIANDQVSFSAARGEIHALLGENGAGKSTLMNILCGLYKPNEGQILIYGRPLDFAAPGDAIAAGIGMVHQHFMLVPTLTVAENVTLGAKDSGFLLDRQTTANEVTTIGQQYGLTVDPQAKIWQLSVGEQQRVEIIKLLARGADILILDEPTAVLTPQESKVLFETLRQMASAGKTIIFISHKLDEVLSIANRITVLRGGKVAATVDAAGRTKTELAQLMVGRPVLFAHEKSAATLGAVRLNLTEAEALDEKRLPALQRLSLHIRAGEILGLAGVAGNGQRELAEVICGLRPLISGQIAIDGKMLDNITPRRMIEAGVAYVPEDRSTTGSAPNLSVAENMALKAYRTAQYGAGALINKQTVLKQAEQLIAEYAIATPSPSTFARKLSGGNLQKVILAREIASSPSVLIASYPTRGLDIGATEHVHKILFEQRSRGSAILLISEDLEELLTLSDRIAVIYEGQIMGEFPTTEANLQRIGLMMAGEKA